MVPKCTQEPYLNFHISVRLVTDEWLRPLLEDLSLNEWSDCHGGAVIQSREKLLHCTSINTQFPKLF